MGERGTRLDTRPQGELIINTELVTQQKKQTPERKIILLHRAHMLWGLRLVEMFHDASTTEAEIEGLTGIMRQELKAYDTLFKITADESMLSSYDEAIIMGKNATRFLSKEQQAVLTPLLAEY